MSCSTRSPGILGIDADLDRRLALGDDVDRRLARQAALDPDTLWRLGADRFPASAVASRRG
jgi:hypothetical protein